MEKQLEKMDIIIAGGALLPMTSLGEIVENPLIGIRDGKILFVEKNSHTRLSEIDAETVLDAAGCVILPGLVNCHTHLGMTCFRMDDLLKRARRIEKRIMETCLS
jgi:5-methylthioadenosine/S-adenosylhomocysteine deaminase